MERLQIVYHLQRALLQGSAYYLGKGIRIYVYLHTHTILWYIYTQ